MKKVILTKLSHLKAPYLDRSAYGGLEDGYTISGYAIAEPKLGERFYVNSERDLLGFRFYTSVVMAIYRHGGLPDKLVLPTGFPEAEKLECPELKEGDMLIATMNSLYHLHEVTP